MITQSPISTRDGLSAASMPVLNIAMVGSDSLAKEIAKASDQRDVHTYVHKENASDGSQRILSLIRPAKFPERLRPLLGALGVARSGLLEITEVNAALGEALIAFSSSGINNGIFVINPSEGGWVDEDQVKGLMQQAGLGEWKQAPPDGIQIREMLQGILESSLDELAMEETLPLIVPVDQFFNVKGIGLVAIGYVQQGKVAVHDELLALPSNGMANARSLQVMDDDVKVAKAGDRVGIAMRNAKEEWLGGGAIVVQNPIVEKKADEALPIPLVECNKTKLTLKKSPFNRRTLEKGDVVHLSLDLQFAVGRVDEVDGDSLIVEWDAPILIRIDGPGRALLNQLDSNPRILGHITSLISC